MDKCFCCSKIVDKDTDYITINKVPICNECYNEYYLDIPTAECHVCHCFTSKGHGIEDALGFTCSACLQDEYYSQIEAFVDDPKHQNIAIDDLFEPPKVKKGFADMISKHNIKRIFRSIYDTAHNLLPRQKDR